MTRRGQHLALTDYLGPPRITADNVALFRQSGIQTLTIASGQTVSSVASTAGSAMFGLKLPAAFTGTVLTFQVSHDNVTFQALYDEFNVAVSVTVAISRSYNLPSALCAWPYFKVVSGSAEGAARSLVLVAKG